MAGNLLLYHVKGAVSDIMNKKGITTNNMGLQCIVSYTESSTV